MSIRIECDNCERSFEAGDGDAGGKVKCPHCGDVNRVPDAGAAAAEPERGGLPPDHGPEQAIRSVHPAMLRAHPFRGAAVTLLFAGGGALMIAAAVSDRVAQWLAWPGLVLMLAGLVWWLAWYVGAHLWVTLEISNKRTIRREGIIRRVTSEVLHDHVRNVEIRQNVLQRVLNVGYLGISSSGQDGIEIEIRDVPKPYEIKAVIDEYREM